eukprot:8012814-Alexandrium_andersonii.AAC.1
MLREIREITLPGPRRSARAVRAERWRAPRRGARDAEHLIPARLQVLLHARQVHSHCLQVVDLVRDRQAQTTAPDRAQ